MPEPSPEFLIEGILPAHEVHLLGGSSGSGKTTFMFQTLLAEWQQGNSVFGHASHPVPYVYISMDRSRSSVNRTLQRLGLAGQITRMVCQEDLKENSTGVDQVIADALKLYPGSKLIIIEGFQLLVGDKGNAYTAVARTLKMAARICTKNKLTIIGICHSPKIRAEEGFQHPREMLLGSVSWGAYSDTVIILSLDELTGIINVHIMPRNAASEQHQLRFGINGRLEAPIKASKQRQMCIKIGSLAQGRPVTKTEILQWASHLKIALRTAERAIKTCVENKVLEPIGEGIYERSVVSLPEIAHDIDLTIEE